MTEDDDALMIAVQSGDGRAFECLVERHQRALLGFFYRNTGDLQLAEDLAQETLLRVYSQAWDYLPRGRFRGWLFRIARNLLIDTSRRQTHDLLLHSLKLRPDQEHDLLANLVGRSRRPEDGASHRELAAAVDELLGELPEEQRLTFTLHHFAGLSLPEVAEAMEIPLATCKSRLRLAREKLRGHLRRLGFGSPVGEELD